MSWTGVTTPAHRREVVHVRSDLISIFPPRLPALLVLVLITLYLSACGAHRQEDLELSGAAAAKVDPELRRAASLMLAEGHGDSSLSVLVRIEGGDEGRDELEKTGMRVDSLVGDVASGSLAARSLAEVAALETVVQIQPSRRLEIKNP